MTNNKLTVVFLATFLLAGMTLSACGAAATPAGPTPTPTPTPTPLETAGKVATGVGALLPPLTSTALALIVAGYFARHARLASERKLPPNFELLQKEAASLREKMNTGRLTEQAYRSKLMEMMVQDDDGNWWIVGKETGSWYRHDGKEWVKDMPPLSQAEAISPIAGKSWVAGVIMAGLHVAIVIALALGLVVTLLLPTEIHFESLPYILIALLYILLVVLLLFLTRGMWSSKRGDGIVVGFALSVASSAVVTALKLAGQLYVVVSNLLIIVGIALTMFFTRKIWSP